MPEIYINGQSVQAELNQSVLQAALAHGFFIPYFCWHPELSVAGNCRICCVQVEGRSWVEIACNMPVSEGLRVLTDSEPVKAYRKSIMQLMTLNHPVDCGICDKAGECTLQDYHYKYNGAPSASRDPKVHATKFYPLSERIAAVQDTPEDRAGEAEMVGAVARFVDGFRERLTDARERAVWTEHLAAEDPVPLGKLGERFDVTKQRMGQIADKLKRRFREEIVRDLGEGIRTDWLRDRD